MPNRIRWTIVHFKPPEAMTLNGDGKGGVKVKLMGKVKPREGRGSTVTFDVHLGGPALFGPIGMVVAGALKGDIRESLDKFKAVFAPASSCDSADALSHGARPAKSIRRRLRRKAKYTSTASISTPIVRSTSMPTSRPTTMVTAPT